ncbi:MAG: pitrilysin family protein [Bacteroidota bacterium]
MKNNFRHLVSFFIVLTNLFVVNTSSAQTVFKGVKTNFNTLVKSDFNFTRTFVTVGTSYISNYKLVDVEGVQFGSVTVVNDKPVAKIKVQLVVATDTSTFIINYTDSLGTIFGSKGPFKKEPVNKYPVSLAFLTENKTYVKVNQIISKKITDPEHFLLERIFADDLTTNATVLAKYKGTQPIGNANKVLSMSDFGVPKANASNPTQMKDNPIQTNPVVTNPAAKDTTKKITTPTKPVVTNPTPKDTAKKTTVTPQTTTVTPPTNTVTVPTVTTPIVTTPVKIKPTNSNVKDFATDSIRSILKPIENEMVSVQLFISGGTSGYTVAKEGIEAVAIDWMLNGGTKNMTPEQVQTKMEQLGIGINYKLTPDYSVISMNCLRKQFDDCWQLFSDLIARSAFAPEVFQTSKDNVSSTSESQNAFDVLEGIALSYSFVGKQYDRDPMGSPGTISKLTADEVKKYYAALMVRRRMTVVVCGNFSVDDLSQRIRTGFKGVTVGAGASTNFGGVDFNGSTFKFVSENENNQNRILGIAAAPDAGSSDEAALTIALAVLNARIQNEVEEKRNLTSDCQFSIAGYRQNFCLLTLTTVTPDKTIQAIIDELKKARKLGFTADELQQAKDQYISNYYLTHESNEAIAKSIGQSEMNDAWEDSENLYATINNLLLTDVNAALRKYIKGFRFYYSGNKDDANEIILTQKLD